MPFSASSTSTHVDILENVDVPLLGQRLRVGAPAAAVAAPAPSCCGSPTSCALRSHTSSGSCQGSLQARERGAVQQQRSAADALDRNASPDRCRRGSAPPALRPCDRPRGSRRRRRRAFRAGALPGMLVKTGIAARRPTPTTASTAVSTVTSPGIQMASTPRDATELAASMTPAVEIAVGFAQLDAELPASGARHLESALPSWPRPGSTPCPPFRGSEEGGAPARTPAPPAASSRSRRDAADGRAGFSRLTPTPAAIRIGDEAEDVHRPAVAVGVRHRLQADRRGGQDEIVFTVGDLLGDGVGGRHVVLGVVAPDRDGPAVDEAALRETVDHPLDPLVDHRLRRMLEDRKARLAGRPGWTPPAVRQQQHRRRRYQQHQPERQAPQRLPHRPLTTRRDDRGANAPTPTTRSASRRDSRRRGRPPRLLEDLRSRRLVDVDPGRLHQARHRHVEADGEDQLDDLTRREVRASSPANVASDALTSRTTSSVKRSTS